MSQHIIFVGLKSGVASFTLHSYLDHISRTVVEDDEALLTFPLGDNEQVGEEEESQVLKITIILLITIIIITIINIIITIIISSVKRKRAKF